MEREFMQNMDHPFIIKLNHYFEDANFIIFVTDFMITDLSGLLNKIKMPVEEHAACHIFRQMV